MTATILIVDDSESVRYLVKNYLLEEGFRVVAAANGREALFISREVRPDLVILDLMMPEMGGYEFMRVYRREAQVPIILLTARVEENDRILGLELGADDYVTKPFSVRELVARVRAVLRRSSHGGEQPDLLRAGEITLDHGGRLVQVHGAYVHMTPSEFDLLAALMGSPGRVFSRLELLERLQGDAFEGYERTIDVHVRNLRAKIEPEPRDPRYIETVYGHGYRFATHL